MARILILNEQTGPRLSVALASEIGLIESILLLQIEFWVSIHPLIRDDRKWTRRSYRYIREKFSFMSKSTIRRAIDNLIDMGLIYATDKYNKRPGDKTTWLSINEEGCSKLNSLSVVRVKKTPVQNGTTPVQNEPTFTMTYTNKQSLDVQGQKQGDTPVRIDDDWDDDWDDDDEIDEFDNWVDSGVELLNPQPYLTPTFIPREKNIRPISEPISKIVHSFMYRLCFRAETEAEQLMLSSSQRGKVASILGKLRDANADFQRIHLFEAWWDSNWRSRAKGTGDYQSPRPEQVLEHWHEAMKADIKPQVIKPSRPPKHNITDLNEIMKKHRDK